MLQADYLLLVHRTLLLQFLRHVFDGARVLHFHFWSKFISNVIAVVVATIAIAVFGIRDDHRLVQLRLEDVVAQGDQRLHKGIVILHGQLVGKTAPPTRLTNYIHGLYRADRLIDLLLHHERGHVLVLQRCLGLPHHSRALHVHLLLHSRWRGLRVFHRVMEALLLGSATIC